METVGRRAETPSGWRVKRGFRKAEADEEQLIRFKAAFDEAAHQHTHHSTLSIARLGHCFHKLGYNDVKPEEIDKLAREHVSSAVQADLEFKEFCSMMATFEEKRKFLSTVRLSREEWVLASLRLMSQHFHKESLSNGEVVWSRAQGDVTGQIILIMKGTCTLLGTMGKVELPICGVGPGALIGNGYLPSLASRVVAEGELDILSCRPEDLRHRMGEQFMQELVGSLEAQEQLFRRRVQAFRDLFHKAHHTPGIRLPFKVSRTVPKGAAAALAGREAQEEASFARLLASPPAPLRSATPASLPPRSPLRSSLALDDFVASPMPKPARRPIPEAAKEGRKQRGGAHTRTYRPFNHRTPQSNIPRMVPKAEYHVRIDTGTMLYDDLM